LPAPVGVAPTVEADREAVTAKEAEHFGEGEFKPSHNTA